MQQTADVAPERRVAVRTAVTHWGDGWLAFEGLRAVVQASTLSEVGPVIGELEAWIARGGVALGFVSYEAAPAFDASMVVRDQDLDGAASWPLVWWALYDGAQATSAPPWPRGAYVRPPDGLKAPADPGYRDASAAVAAAIAAGEIYQANYTYRLHARMPADALSLAASMERRQRGAYATVVDADGVAVASASPELFFELEGTRLTSRPMKGTVPRGRYPEEDRERAQALLESEKERAENLMIVDMVRNDLGRVARSGSVGVERLYQVETYPTLHTLTSTVSARTNASFAQVLTALFPAASVTGAPKIAAMRHIARLESSPRELYTGTVAAVLGPRQARCSVAIRTAWSSSPEAQREEWRYGTGSGLVSDSLAQREDAECRLKASVFLGGSRRQVNPRLYETMLLRSKARGFWLLEEHLGRLRGSARHYGYPFDEPALRARLAELVERGAAPLRVRALLDADGELEVETGPVAIEKGRRRRTWIVALAASPTDVDRQEVFHKTTERSALEEAVAEARQRVPDCDDVLLYNQDGYLTEGSRTNVAVRLGGRWLTPPVACGLLAGTLRERLLGRGRVEERPLRVEELRAAETVVLLNSVRGIVRVQLVE